MNRFFYSLFIVTFFCTLFYSKAGFSQSNKNDYTQFVNPFIGTSGRAHTFPGATYPHGFIQLSPRTGNRAWKYTGGYQYEDTTLMGFFHNQLSGGGGAGLGDILILPYSTDLGPKPHNVSFSKKDEFASPGYYSVRLKRDDILVELSATERTGIQKYTFNKVGKYTIFIDINEINEGWWYDKSISKVDEASLSIENKTTLSGFIETKLRGYRKSYFAIQLSKPFSTSTYTKNSKNRKLQLNYNLTQKDSIEIRVSISTVSIESARNNLRSEAEKKSFDEIKKATQKKWNEYLSTVDISAPKDQKEIFYTALYHTLIQPNNIADVDGKYFGGDRKIHTSPSGKMYSTFAFWDTFRGLHPLYTILYPEKTGEFIATLSQYFEDTGNLPVWAYYGGDSYTMIGNHSVPVIVDAYLKGIKGFDAEKAYEAIKTTLTTDHWIGKKEASGRKWRTMRWSNIDIYGYHPSDKIFGESVSRTLEDSYDAWCASEMAKELGKTDDYKLFKKRSGSYKNVFDQTTMFMRGKNSDSSWVAPFDPLLISHVQSSGGDYTEGNAWQWLWSVQHDPEGLIALFGDKKNFINKLDSLFLLPPTIHGKGSTNDVSGLIGQYAHGNEPSQHVAYLYNYAGQPHKTQALIHKIMNELYSNTPNGMSGNDDFGQMSAWYILNTFGFYPVNPASGVFDIGRPAVKEAILHLGDNTLTIKTENFSPDNKYIASVALNGKVITDYKISYKDIMNGGEFVFTMSDKPSE